MKLYKRLPSSDGLMGEAHPEPGFTWTRFVSGRLSRDVLSSGRCQESSERLAPELTEELTQRRSWLVPSCSWLWSRPSTDYIHYSLLLALNTTNGCEQALLGVL